MARGFRGVKDDLSEIGRHILDIACFLAPLLSNTYTDSPPPSPHSDDYDPNNNSNSLVAGALSDFKEIGGSLKGGISRLSNVLRRNSRRNNSSSDDSKDSVDAAAAAGCVESGVRSEVVEFIRDLVKCPESWLEFPVPIDNNFDMSRHQRDHIATVERLVPSLGALRITLCPGFMNEDSFWKIYFALLHPRLNKHEAEFLSTPQIVEEMRMNLKKMQSRVNTAPQYPMAESSSTSIVDSAFQNPVAEGSSSSREISEFQSPVTENSSSMMGSTAVEIREEDEAQSSAITATTSLQYIPHWFDTPASTDTRKQLRSKEDAYYAETEDDDNIVLLKKYKGSPSVDAADQDPAFYSSEKLQLRKKVYSIDKELHTSQDKKLVDEDSSDWNEVEEDSSDFEIVDRS